MLQDQPDTKVTSPPQASREASHQHHQDQRTPSKNEEFAKTFEEAISTKNPQSTGSDTWIHLPECNSNISTSSDWLDVKSLDVTKRAELAGYKRSPSEKTLKTLNIKICSEQGPTDKKEICTRVLTRAQSRHPDCSGHRQHQSHVRWHHESSRTNSEQNSTHLWGSHHRQRGNKWSDGYSTTQSSTPERTVLLTRHWMQSNLYPAWRT